MRVMLLMLFLLPVQLAVADYEKGCLSAHANFRSEMSSYYDLDQSKKKYLEEGSDEAARSAQKLVNKSVEKAYRYGVILQECRAQGLIK